jgi:hypothetical protein
VEQYNQIVTVLKNWGDDDFIHNNPDDPTAIEHLRFRHRNATVGYNYKNHWRLEEVEDADGNPKINLLKASNNKIVLHMRTCLTPSKRPTGGLVISRRRGR